MWNSELQVWAIFRALEVIHITVNMGACDLPNMYALSPRTSGMHIRQIPYAYVVTIACD